MAEYKIWIEIEELDKNGRGHDAGIMPDCVGTSDTLRGAKAQAWKIVRAYGIDPENSDLQPGGYPPGRKGKHVKHKKL
jgi:hypothetical protein